MPLVPGLAGRILTKAIIEKLNSVLEEADSTPDEGRIGPYKFDSTNVESAMYLVKERHLIITFKKKGKYVYSNVPRYIFEELLLADSKGKYVHANIRDVYNFDFIG